MKNSIQLLICYQYYVNYSTASIVMYRVFTNYKHHDWEKRSRQFAAITRNLQESGLLLDAPGRAYIHQHEDRDPDFLGNKLNYSAIF